MKKLNKRARLLLASALLALFVLIPAAALAVEEPIITFHPSVPIPGLDIANIEGDSLARYIAAGYNFLVSFAAIAAVTMMTIGGVIWLTSSGNPAQIGKAKDFIVSAAVGLALVLLSWSMLYTINPELVSLKSLDVKGISMSAQEAQEAAAAAEITETEAQRQAAEAKQKADEAKRNEEFLERFPDHAQVSADAYVPVLDKVNDLLRESGIESPEVRNALRYLEATANPVSLYIIQDKIKEALEEHLEKTRDLWSSVDFAEVRRFEQKLKGTMIEIDGTRINLHTYLEDEIGIDFDRYTSL